MKSAKDLIEKTFDEYEVEVINFNIISRELKLFKLDFAILKGKGFHNLKRHLMCRKFAKEKIFGKKSKFMFTEKKLVEYLFKESPDIIITMMDVWNVNSNKEDAFPSPWWLNYHLPRTKKVAFSVSAHRSIEDEFNKMKDSISKVLNDFKVIGARDTFTYKTIKSLDLNNIFLEMVPDMTFSYKIKQKKNLIYKIPLLNNKKLIGTAISDKTIGNTDFLNKYRKKGYKIIETVGYSENADFNIGDILNPEEWAQVMGYFDLFITDKYHGTIFSLKNKTPVLSVDIYPEKNSKIYPLLKDFKLLDESYCDKYTDNNELISKIDYLLKDATNVKNKIHEGLLEKEAELLVSVQKIRKILFN